ncbi:zinc finger protein 501-like [Chrysoperla carnea]|uniref:zinc finger protein 501-like n=1 Tax=Chrysoperla carnea TaxID=189513 RepID=UPI001D080477|nr:zinc finger protein 501-like [Chrysoperla carnea]
MNKLNNAIEFRKQCEVSEKIIFKLREIQQKETNSAPNLIENVKINESDIKPEGSYDHLHEDISDTRNGSKISKTKEDAELSNVSDFCETVINENENVNLKTAKKIDVDCTLLDEQPLSERLITANRNLDYKDDEILSQCKDESIKLRAKKRKKSNEQNRYFDVKKFKIEETIDDKELEVKVDDDTAVNIGLQCPQCGKSFELREDLEIHKLQHKKLDDLICPKCSKSFGNEQNLKRHLNIHMVNKPYKCDYCEKSFAGSGDRIRHLRTHTGERPYICQTCGKRFPDSSGLSQHMKYHHNIKSYVCSICSKGFVFPSELQMHIRVHTGEKPFLCTECGESFCQSYSLTKHKRKHTGERPHACTECDKTFRLKEQLKFHIRTHTGYKPHVCKICEIGFARPESLVIHFRTHTGERPYACNICEKAFRSNKCLNQHKRTHNINNN